MTLAQLSQNVTVWWDYYIQAECSNIAIFSCDKNTFVFNCIGWIVSILTCMHASLQKHDGCFDFILDHLSSSICVHNVFVNRKHFQTMTCTHTLSFYTLRFSSWKWVWRKLRDINFCQNNHPLITVHAVIVLTIKTSVIKYKDSVDSYNIHSWIQTNARMILSSESSDCL